MKMEPNEEIAMSRQLRSGIISVRRQQQVNESERRQPTLKREKGLWTWVNRIDMSESSKAYFSAGATLAALGTPLH